MSFDQRDDDLISDYIQGILTKEEKESFEQRLAQEEDLRKEVMLQKGVAISLQKEGWVDWDHTHNQVAVTEIKAIKRSTEIMDLEAKVNKASDTYFKNRASATENNYYKKYIIGLVAAAVVSVLMLRVFSDDSSMITLYDTNVNWDQNLISKIEQSTSSNNTAQIGESFFKNGEYNKAKEIFLELLSTTNNPDNHSLMYLGASYLELKEYEQAIQIFDALLKGNTLDSNRAYWYKAMVYLKKEDKAAAKHQLTLLTSNPQHYNYEEAMKLLQELE